MFMSSGDVIGFAIGLVIVLVIGHMHVTWLKNKVRADLERRGFQTIKRREEGFSAKFYVEYRNADGLIIENTCIVYISLFTDAMIYWEKPFQ